ncbi:MAG: hypothetical protein QG668_325 [Patescibacteria group bacterium]|nr:hypothetical protein [Patescibacteria group bacterium]
MYERFSPSPVKKPGLLSRLALMAGLATAPSMTSSEVRATHAEADASTVLTDRQATRSRIDHQVLLQRISEAYEQTDTAQEQETGQGQEDGQERLTQLIDQAMVLFDETHMARENADDLQTYVRTQAQTLRSEGASVEEVNALVRSLTAGLYERISNEMDRLDEAGRGEYALDLQEAFASWNPNADTPQESVQAGETRVESEGRLVQLEQPFEGTDDQE